MNKIKTRFAPSPTGSLHVGGARTALFNYLLAAGSGGTFLVRIEDTDRARHDELAVGGIVEDLRWLGIEWDEGIGVGGDAGPYRQSERLEIYREHIERLLDEQKAYFAFDTPDELDAMRKQAAAAKQTFTYPRPEKIPSRDDAEDARAQGRPVVVRMLNPNRDVTFHDEVFSDITIPANQQDDFIIQKSPADGQDAWPTYHLANVVDDALMGVNFICRGQEFLGQTWRHVLLREALGFDEPKYCHLPLIMDMAGRKLSKRDGDVEVSAFRKAGYLPQVIVNFIALLGWRPDSETEKLSLDELVEFFSVERIGKSNAKFDRDKLLAFNTDGCAESDVDTDADKKQSGNLLAPFKDYLSLNTTSLPNDDATLKKLIEINRGFRTFADIVAKCSVLFVGDNEFDYDEKAVKKILLKNENAGFEMLKRVSQLLPDEDNWKAEQIETAVKQFCEDKQIGMGKVAQPLRVAVTGTTISPPIGQTLKILGRDKTLARINRCLKLWHR